MSIPGCVQKREKNKGELRDWGSQDLHILIEVKSSHKKEPEQWAGRLQTRRLIKEKCIKLEEAEENFNHAGCMKQNRHTTKMI